MQSKSLDFRQVEWWMVTTAILTAFLFVLFGHRPSFHSDSGYDIFRFSSRLLILAAIYGAFHLIHMVLIPKFEKDINKWPSIVWTVFTGIISFGIIALFGFNSDLIKAPFPAFYLGTIVLYICYLLAAHVLSQALTPPKVRDFQLYNIIRLIIGYLFTLFCLIQLEPISSHGPAIIFAFFPSGHFYRQSFQLPFGLWEKKSRKNQASEVVQLEPDGGNPFGIPNHFCRK